MRNESVFNILHGECTVEYFFLLIIHLISHSVVFPLSFSLFPPLAPRCVEDHLIGPGMYYLEQIHLS